MPSGLPRECTRTVARRTRATPLLVLPEPVRATPSSEGPGYSQPIFAGQASIGKQASPCTGAGPPRNMNEAW